MIVYLDSSAVLRIVLGQSGSLAEWSDVSLGVASALVEVECLRTLDRLRLTSGVPASDVALRREVVFRIMSETEIVEPNWPVLRRASQPFPVPIGTLDALHLASALMWRDSRGQDLVMATHDRSLGLAARASGLEVIGV